MHHCKRCDVCIKGYDHHCPWVSKCIGASNIKRFYFFVCRLFYMKVLLLSISFISCSCSWSALLSISNNKMPNFDSLQLYNNSDNTYKQASCTYPESFIIELLVKHRSIVIEVMDKFKFILIAVALLKHRPNSIGLVLSQTIVYYISTHQNDVLLGEQLSKEGVNHIGLRVRSFSFKILQESAKLNHIPITKQSFCHWVINLKCPPFLKTGRRKKGALLALNYQLTTYYERIGICAYR